MSDERPQDTIETRPVNAAVAVCAAALALAAIALAAALATLVVLGWWQ